jgi:signal transduction histidine kinase
MRIIKENKKTFISYFILLIIFLSMDILIMNIQYKKYINIVNNKISNIVNVIDDDNKEQEIYEILNSKTNDLPNILNKYNLDSDSSYIKLLNNNMKESIYINISIYVLFMVISFIVLYQNIKKRDNDLQELIEYIKNINNGYYGLEINSNEEGILSKLKNELYKITINLKEIAEYSQNKEKNLSVSLADITHQIKTPLTSISILLDNIKDNPKMDNKTKKEFINEISKQTENIKYLSINLLKLSKFDAGVISFISEKIFVYNLFKDVIKNLEVLIETKNVTINLNICKNIYFEGDFSWEKEAYINIIKNSIEAISENGIIDISSEMNSLFTKIIIVDNGKGIDEEDQKHIFERFYKGKNSSKDSYGIGLNLAKNIIEKDNGYIMVDSIINKGTKFTIKYIFK